MDKEIKVLAKETKWAGNFLNLHHYHLNDGRIYEVCSRKSNPDPKECDAVDIVAFNEDKTKVCVIVEYRIPVEGYCIAFPAGLREAGEGIFETAQRELWEECGLHISTIYKILEPSFQSAGMSDESVATVVCSAAGDITNEHQEKCENIRPVWVTKAEAKKIVESGQNISARCQIFLALWSGFIPSL